MAKLLNQVIRKCFQVSNYLLERSPTFNFPAKIWSYKNLLKPKWSTCNGKMCKSLTDFSIEAFAEYALAPKNHD